MLQSPLAVTSSSGSATKKGAPSSRVLDVSDLSFTKAARGGPIAAEFRLSEWVNTYRADLGVGSRVKVWDSRTGQVLWEGYQDLPGRQVGSGGHEWSVGASGAHVVLADRSRAFIVIDTALEGFRRTNTTTKGATSEVTSRPEFDDTPAILLQFPDGIHIVNGSKVLSEYDDLSRAGQFVGGMGVTRECGVNNNDYRSQILLDGTVLVDTGADKAPNPYTPVGYGTTWTADLSILKFRLTKDTGGAWQVGNDNIWEAFYNFWIKARRRDLTGVNVTTGNGQAYAYAHHVIPEALWHLTDLIDVPASTVATTFTHQIDQMAYPDGVKMQQVLEDLSVLEPGLIWSVDPTGTNGLHPFTAREWDSDTRYEVTTRDGWQQTGGESQLANRLRVYYTDKRGKTKSNLYANTTVSELSQWGRLRDVEAVTLGSELGSDNAADKIGAAYLAQFADAPHSGTATITRRIRDRYRGCLVWPWEIEPGYKVTVADTDLPPMRLEEMSYNDSDQSASLTLGTPFLSPEELAGKLTHQRPRRRRG